MKVAMQYYLYTSVKRITQSIAHHHRRFRAWLTFSLNAVSVLYPILTVDTLYIYTHCISTRRARVRMKLPGSLVAKRICRAQVRNFVSYLSATRVSLCGNSASELLLLLLYILVPLRFSVFTRVGYTYASNCGVRRYMYVRAEQPRVK